MFFYLSKFVWFFLQPSAASIFVILIGLALLKTRRRKFGRKLITLGAVAVLLIAFSPLGRQLMIPLEDRFPVQSLAIEAAKKVDGIIVLGGTVHMTITDQRGVPSLVSGAERIIEAVKLAKKHPQARIVLAGGPNTIVSKPTADSEVVKQLMIDMGVKPERIELEISSKNTWQNAMMAKEIAQPTPGETWVLVTSAYHMPRAIGCFRAVNWPVIAYPVDFTTGGERSRFQPFYYALDGVTVTDIAAKEWLGLLAYYLSGRTTSVFPSPAQQN